MPRSFPGCWKTGSCLQLIGILPEDEQVAVANANGKPLPSSCRASQCFENIATRFLGGDAPLARLEKL